MLIYQKKFKDIILKVNPDDRPKFDSILLDLALNNSDSKIREIATRLVSKTDQFMSLLLNKAYDPAAKVRIAILESFDKKQNFFNIPFLQKSKFIINVFHDELKVKEALFAFFRSFLFSDYYEKEN